MLTAFFFRFPSTTLFILSVAFLIMNDNPPQDSILTSFFSLTPSQAHHDGHCLTITTSSPLHIPDGSDRPLAHAQQRNSCFACLLDTNDILLLRDHERNVRL